MKDLDNNLKERTGLFKKIGPEIAGEMSKALQILTRENIKVEFTGVQTFEQSTLVMEVGEKCFGSYINFRNPEVNLDGIAVAVFPLSGSKFFTELLLRRYVKKFDKETVGHEMKLSAFKEGIHMLIMGYITGLANALEVKLEMSVPKFVSFHNIKFIKPALLRKYSKLDSLISVRQFRIIKGRSKDHSGGGENGSNSSSVSSIKGRFIIIF